MRNSTGRVSDVQCFGCESCDFIYCDKCYQRAQVREFVAQLTTFLHICNGIVSSYLSWLLLQVECELETMRGTIGAYIEVIEDTTPYVSEEDETIVSLFEMCIYFVLVILSCNFI
jgi:hypothetical protein